MFKGNRTLVVNIAGMLMMLMAFSNCKKKEKTEPSLKVGDKYQGGIIAYILQNGDSGHVSGEIHGIIAAPSDQDSSAEWGCYSTLIAGANNVKIGSGKGNTKAILDGCVTSSTAARICGDLVLNGYDDWYLPGKEELQILYEARTLVGLFRTKFSYWSSTQCDDKGAWKLNFKDGQFQCYGKLSGNYVRAVRFF